MDLIFKLDEIDNAAKSFLQFTAPGRVFAFYGEMGTGKTTFILAVCKELKVNDQMGSPTYSIINQYQTNQTGMIYHMDLYRLKNEEEAIQAGIEDCLYSGNYCFIEWPERAAGILPDHTVAVSISSLNNDTRKLTIKL